MVILLNHTKRFLVEFYLKLEDNIFYQMRMNAVKSIDKDFTNKEINVKIYKIIRKYQKSSG